MAIEVGSIVRLKDNPSAGIATVVCFLESVKGGVRLSRRLDGFMFWNVAELKVGSTANATVDRDANRS